MLDSRNRIANASYPTCKMTHDKVSMARGRGAKNDTFHWIAERIEGVPKESIADSSQRGISRYYRSCSAGKSDSMEFLCTSHVFSFYIFSPFNSASSKFNFFNFTFKGTFSSTFLSRRWICILLLLFMNLISSIKYNLFFLILNSAHAINLNDKWSN